VSAGAGAGGPDEDLGHLITTRPARQVIRASIADRIHTPAVRLSPAYLEAVTRALPSASAAPLF
jgi:hypothetical protein